MGRIVGFEINSQDPEKAVKFYSEVFGWKFSEPQWDYREVSIKNTEGSTMELKKLIYSIMGTIIAFLIIGVFTGQLEWYELITGTIILVVVHFVIVFFVWNLKI